MTSITLLKKIVFWHWMSNSRIRYSLGLHLNETYDDKSFYCPIMCFSISGIGIYQLSSNWPNIWKHQKVYSQIQSAILKIFIHHVWQKQQRKESNITHLVFKLLSALEGASHPDPLTRGFATGSNWSIAPRKKYKYKCLSVLSFLFILLLYYLLYATSRGE